jgi:dienelactone hydrolase
MQGFAISASLFLLYIASSVRCQTIDWPKPTGPFVHGYHEFEFLDTVYPSYRDDDADGRRLLVQVWYPACRVENVVNKTFCGNTNMGRLRYVLEKGEGEFYYGFAPGDSPLADELSAQETYSFIDAPLASGLENGSPPVVVYSHGLPGYVSENMVLMQELASQGYAVFALASPGFAGAVLYSNGDIAKYDAVLGDPAEDLKFLGAVKSEEDIEARFETNKQYLQSSPRTTYLPRGRDDQLALTKYLRSQTNTSTLLGQLTGGKGSLDVVFMGHSFGGAASALSAQLDDQALCGLNMDGYQYSPSLFGGSVGKPFLTLVSGWDDTGQDDTRNYNEFFYEPLTTMGSDCKVIRTRLFDTVHNDFNDIKFIPKEAGGTGQIDPFLIHEIMVSFILGFLSTCFSSGSDWTPESSLQLFSNATENVDLTYVAEWAQDYGYDQDYVFATKSQSASPPALSPASPPTAPPASASQPMPKSSVRFHRTPSCRHGCRFFLTSFVCCSKAAGTSKAAFIAVCSILVSILFA